MRQFFSGRITVKMSSVSHKKKLTLDSCASNVRIFLRDMYPPPFGAYIKYVCYSLVAFSWSMALILSFTSCMSSFSFCILRFISSISELPFFELALRKPRLFS